MYNREHIVLELNAADQLIYVQPIRFVDVRSKNEEPMTWVVGYRLFLDSNASPLHLTTFPVLTRRTSVLFAAPVVGSDIEVGLSRFPSHILGC